MEKNNGWTTRFYVTQNGSYPTSWLVIEHGSNFSYNGVLYKTQGGAKKGAKAEFNKINKEFEKIILS